MDCVFLLLDAMDAGMKDGCSLKEFVLVINSQPGDCRWT